MIRKEREPYRGFTRMNADQEIEEQHPHHKDTRSTPLRKLRVDQGRLRNTEEEEKSPGIVRGRP